MTRGRTRLSVHEVYSPIEARDAAVASGMESGILESYERLDRSSWPRPELRSSRGGARLGHRWSGQPTGLPATAGASVGATWPGSAGAV